jgi:hypothetical protein
VTETPLTLWFLDRYEYYWADGKEVKKAQKVSAPEYVDLLMTWVQKLLDDESVFPSKIGVPFPKNFHSVTKQIFKRLFRVYAHIYHAHFKVVVHELGEEAHLNTSFKHFIYFVQVRALFSPLHMSKHPLYIAIIFWDSVCCYLAGYRVRLRSVEVVRSPRLRPRPQNDGRGTSITPENSITPRETLKTVFLTL